MRKRLLFAVAIFYASMGASQQQARVGSLKFLDGYVVPHDLPFRNTTVGGLSGIDYDPKTGNYYLICDDRSSINPARYYTARIRLNKNRIDTVYFTAVTTLRARNGSPYPATEQDPSHTPDPEALRYDALRKRMVWSSEGERIVKPGKLVMENPAITIMRTDGAYIDTFPLPAGLVMHATENGPRQNGVLEGLSFAHHYKDLYVNLEEPRYEDGPRADVTDNDAWIRFYKFDVASRKNTGQYAYKLDPIAYPAQPADAFKVNGIPDILWVGEERFLVLERSFSTGRVPCTIKIFLADLDGATDIRDNPSLIEQPAAKPISKKLLFNLDSLGRHIDNVEGATLGPLLPNGHRSLLLVADNNFAAYEQTQFFLFEIIP